MAYSNKLTDVSAYEIRDEAAIAEIKECIGRFWGIRHKLTHLPAPQPVPLRHKDLPLLKHKKYVVAEKTDGERFLLLMGRFDKSKNPYAVLINRTFRIFQLQLYAPKVVYQGSLFDGELVWNTHQEKYTLMVFDCVALNGRSIIHEHFITRYRVINQHFIANNIPIPIDKKAAITLAKLGHIVNVPDNPPYLGLFSKPYVTMDVFGSLIRSIKRIQHPSDGFIFMPVEQPIGRNTQYDLFKWKYAPSIDVSIDNEGIISCMSSNRLTPLSVVFPEIIFQYTGLSSITMDIQENFIIEVNITADIQENTYLCQYHRLRNDKNFPNHAKTIESVLHNARNPITLDMLLNVNNESKINNRQQFIYPESVM